MIADKLDKPIDAMPSFSWKPSGGIYTVGVVPTSSITITAPDCDEIYKAVGDLGIYSLDDGLEGDYVV